MIKSDKSFCVLHVISQLGRGGAESMLFRLCEQAKREGDRFVILSLGGMGEYGKAIQALGHRVEALEKRNLLQGLSKLIKLIREERPLYVQGWMYHGDLMALAAKSMGYPVAWNVRCSNVNWDQYSKKTGRLVKWLAKLSFLPDVVLINSNAGKKAHIDLGYHPKRWEVIPNGFDTDIF